MTQTQVLTRNNLLVAVATVGLFFTPSAWAANSNGTWTNTAGGTWGDTATGNWSGGIVADGNGYTADFSTLDITANTTVSLDAPRTIGNLVFGDTTTSTSAVGWVLANGGSVSNILTLAGTTPTITVNALGGNGSSGDSPFGTATISAAIAGTQGFVKDGTGTISTSILVLSGANTGLSGPISINSGSIRVKSSSALGTGAVTVANGARLQLSGGVTVANTININGANALYSHSGSATPNLSGTVNMQSDSGISLNNGNGNAAMILSGTLNLSGHILTTATINLSPAITISAVINGSGGITKTNDGTLRISNDNSTTYSGTTKLQRGVLELGSDGALGTGTFDYATDNDQAANIRSASTDARTIANLVTISSGTSGSVYRFGSSSASLNGNLSFTNTTTISLGTIQRKFDVYNQTRFNAGFTGTGVSGIVKQQAGTLILAGNSTYTGATTVSAGALQVDGSLANTAVGVTGSTLSGSGSILGRVTLNANTHLNAGTAGTVGRLLLNGGLTTTANTANLDFDLGAPTTLGVTYDAITANTGTADDVLIADTQVNITTLPGFASGTYHLLSWLGSTAPTNLPTLHMPADFSTTYPDGNAYLQFAGNSLDLIVTIPEPSTAAMMVVLGAGLTVLRRRRA